MTKINARMVVDTDGKTVSEKIGNLSDLQVTVGYRDFSETTDDGRIKRAIDKVAATGGKVELPKGTFEIDPAVNLSIPDNVKFCGSGKDVTILKSSTRRTVNMIDITGSNVAIEDISIDLSEYDETSNLTEIALIGMNGGVNGIQILRCDFRNGYAGVWFNPWNRGTIYDVTIQNCVFTKLRHSIYIGINDIDNTNRTDRIFNILINGNLIQDGLFESDGIKTAQRCDDLIITNNIIKTQTRDAIDLFASGNNVIVANNIIKLNSVAGIDIKQNLVTYPNETYGYNQKMLITGNIIYGNVWGITIAQNGTSVNHLIVISNNTISDNTQDGISCQGSHVNIISNLIYKNCLRSDVAGSTYGGIYLNGDSTKRIRSVNIIGNQIVNNGAVGTEANGIRLFSYIDDCNIKDNMIENNTDLENPNNQKVGLYIGATCLNITVRDNKIKNHTRDVWVRNGADVHGESVRISIGDVLKASLPKYYAGIQVKSNKVSIIDAKFVNGASIPVHNVSTDPGYINMEIVKIVNGVFSSYLAKSDTNTTGGALSAYVPRLINAFTTNTDVNVDNNAVNKDEMLAFQITPSGGYGGRDLTNASVEIRYIKY